MEDDGTDLQELEKYLATRSPTHHYLMSNNMRRGPRELLKTAKKYDMPLVEALLLQDLTQLREKDFFRWNRVYQRTFRMSQGQDAVAPVQEAHEESEIRGKGVVEMVGGERTVGEEGRRNRVELSEEEEIEARRLHWLDSRDALRSVVDTGSRTAPLPPAIVAESSADDTPGRLMQLWETFSSTIDVSQSTEDLQLCLTFLHYLVSPDTESAEPTPAFLTLALQVFQHLVESGIPEACVASPPTHPDLPRPVIVQTILLRTIVAVANDEQFFDLADKALKSLGVFRERHPNPDDDNPDIDLILLEGTISSITSFLREARVKSYRPTPSPPLLLAHSLVTTLLPQWTPAESVTTPRVSEDTAAVLDNFATELAQHSAWYLLASMWETWGMQEIKRGWTMQDHRRKLLRWYGGDAPFAVYGYPGSEVGEDGRSVRGVRTRQFEELAAESYIAFKSGKGGVGTWSREQKSDWIQLLCQSRASRPRSHDLARRCYTLFVRGDARGSQGKFALNASVVLALVRCSSPPVGKAQPFAAQLVKDFIAVLMSPSSAYSSPTRTLDHYDLTTLAHCYALLGDPASVAQVYRKLLDQNMLPDAKDLALICSAAARRQPEDALLYFKMISALGIALSRDTMQQIMLATVTHSRVTGVSPWALLNTLVRLAAGAGMSTEDVRGLQDYIEVLSVRGKPLRGERRTTVALKSARGGQFDEVRLSSLTPLLRQAYAPETTVANIVLYIAAIDTGVLDETALYTALNGLLAGSGSQGDGTDDVEHAFIKFIDHALFATPSLITRVSTYELALRCCVRLGDFAAFCAVKGRMDEAGLEPREKLVESMGSWAVGLVGEEEVEREGGWLSIGREEREEQ